MATNISLPLSQSPTGTPIVINSSAGYPGQLIHLTSSEQDFIWLWAGITEFIDYTDALYLRIVKGNSSTGYFDDSIVQINPTKKVQIESGVLLSGAAELRAYIDSSASTVTGVSVAISGYVHRRIA